LDEAPTQVPPETVATESLAIARLWECTLGTQPAASP
jgi:hypothetical protein